MVVKQQKAIAPGTTSDVRVFIVAAIRLYREGLCELLAQAPGLRVIGTAGSYSEFVEQWNDVNSDVLLLDINISNSLEIARRVYTSASHLKMVALSVEEADDSIVSWAEAGISAFVTENGSLQNMVDAIHNAKAGKLHCKPKVVGKLIHRLAVLGAAKTQSNGLKRLTVREQEILELVERALSNKEIARRLNIEVTTVKNHVHNLMEKLNVHRRERAAAYLREHRSY